MKNLFKLLAIAAVSMFAVAACSKEEETGEGGNKGPVYAIKVPITGATATQGTESAIGVIDNDAKTIKFVFENPGVDLSKVTVALEFAAKATPKNFKEPTVCDFSGEKTVTCTVNNQKEDVNYTVSAVATAIANPVTKVYAVATNQKTIDATVDNINHTVKFFFVPGQVEVSSVNVVMELAAGVKAGANCFEEKAIDLTGIYTFTLNDGLKDLQYTITAEFAQATLVNSTNCRVMSGFAGETPAADPQKYDPDGKLSYANYNSAKDFLNNPENLFDGIWMSGAEKWGEVAYCHFGVGGEKKTEFDNWFVFEIGESRQIASITIMPYYPYDKGQVPAQYEFYAYTGTGEPSSFDKDGGMWELVATEDISTWWDLQKDFRNGKAGSTDLCINGCKTNFNPDAPAARYYCFKMINNFYMLKGPETDAPSWYGGRAHWITMSEFIIYAY